MKVDKNNNEITLTSLELLNIIRVASWEVNSPETTADMDAKGMDSGDFEVRVGFVIAHALIAAGATKEEVLAIYNRQVLIGPTHSELN